jgi:hypothetical protein
VTDERIDVVRNWISYAVLAPNPMGRAHQEDRGAALDSLDSLEAELERLREALEAMMPGVLASEREYLTNPAYHACVYIAHQVLADVSKEPRRD